jgi:ABC-type transport system involved in multi-copper enzyme maturation permease subunit
MLRAFKSEWFKIRRISVLAGGGAMIAFATLFSYLGIDRAVAQAGSAAGRGPEGLTPARLATIPGMTDFFGRSSSMLQVIALVIVAAAMAAEFSQGTLRNLLVRDPVRLRLLAGKMIALMTYVTIAAVAAMAVAFGVGVLEALHVGISTSAWTSSDGWRALLALDANVLLAVLGFSVMGLFFATMFRSAAAAVGVSLAYLLAVEGILVGFWSELGKWLPGQMLDTIATGNPALTYGRAATTAAAYMAAMIVVVAVVFHRRDVTS